MTSYVVSNLRVGVSEKRYIFVLLEITFSNSWQYHYEEFHSLVDNVLANLIALT